MKNSTLWNASIDEVYAHLNSQRTGLTEDEAQKRLQLYGPNSIKPPRKSKGILLFFSQIKSPLIILLIGAAILSYFLGGHTDALIICIIVAFSSLLGFFQERGALSALETLLQLVASKIRVVRNREEREILLSQVVPGDIILLRAGDLIPADCILIEATHLFVDEATLTGESIPVEKMPGHSSEPNHLRKSNALFLGTTVASGFGVAIAMVTGKQTQYGLIAERMYFHPPETAFELHIRKLGYFLLEITLILVITIFAFNAYLKKPVIDALLFSLALAVGLTPQLLPAIISINLSHGARKMAKKHVVVKRLASIENFGQMDILCTDKTGTITLGTLRFKEAVTALGEKSDKVAFYGFLNAHFQSGYSNPLDQALLQTISFSTAQWKKVDEIPYDFIRKRLSILVEIKGKQILISKGAVLPILSICNRIESLNGSLTPLDGFKESIQNYMEKQSQNGFRTIAVAYGEGDQEKDLIFLGFLTFEDPIKPDIVETVQQLKKKGVSLKIITGDYQESALYIAGTLNIPHPSLITGSHLHNISNKALMNIVEKTSIFAEIEPNQKERIILALRQSGHVVGFLGDGINDMSALHSADVGIAVEGGVNAAKEAADIVLLKKDLLVLKEGIEEGRSTFANTVKYIYMATSANFGNMFSMATISPLLSFLPLLPKQVLLTNLLSDFPEMALATDRVDSDIVAQPVRWDLPLIRRFMLVFGLLSSVSDWLTFGVLLFWLKADETLFRTGWFIESVASAALIAFAIRTRRPFWRSTPSYLLSFFIIAIALGVFLLPFTPLGKMFGFTRPPFLYYPILIGIIGFYFLSIEIAKYFFFRCKKGRSKFQA